MISNRKNVSTLPRYLGEHGTQKDSIPRTGMSLNKKKMNGRYQTNGRGFTDGVSGQMPGDKF